MTHNSHPRSYTHTRAIASLRLLGSLALLFLTVSILLAGCGGSGFGVVAPSTGSLSITFAASPTILIGDTDGPTSRTLKLAEALVTVSRLGKTASSVVDISSGSATAIFDSLEAGTWSIDVTTYDTTSARVHRGHGSAAVLGGKAATASVGLELIPGTLRVNMDLAPSDPASSATLTLTASGDPGIVTNLALNSTSASASISSLAPKTWVLLVELFDSSNNVVAWCRSPLLILPDRTTTADISPSTSGGSGDDMTISVEWNNPPEPPTNLKAEAYGSGVRLTWSASPDPQVVGYLAYRSYSFSGAKTILNGGSPIVETGYVDYTSSPGQFCWYWVQSVNAEGVGGGFSQPATIESASDSPYADPEISVPQIIDGQASFRLTAEAGTASWLVLYPATTSTLTGTCTVFTEPTDTVRSSLLANLTAQSLGGFGAGSLRLGAGASSIRGSRPIRSRWQPSIEMDKIARESEQQIPPRGSAYGFPPNVGLNGFRGSTEAVGDVRSFTVLRDAINPSEVQATCEAISPYSVIYVENSLVQDPRGSYTRQDAVYVAEMLDEMSSALTSVFGDGMDCDSNGRFTILLTPLDSDLLGYYWAENEFPRSYQHPYSNFADMIVVNSSLLDDITTLKATIAHEYQHYLFYSGRAEYGNGTVQSDIFLTEAFSMLAMDLVGVGYIDGAGVSSHMVDAWKTHHAEWSLTSWPDARSNVDRSPYYGGAYLFARYLYDQFGSTGLQRIIHSPYAGVTSVEMAVSQTMNELFRSLICSIIFRIHGVEPVDLQLGFDRGVSLSADGLACVDIRDYESQSWTVALQPYGVQFFKLQGTYGRSEVNVDLSTSGGTNYKAVVVEGLPL